MSKSKKRQHQQVQQRRATTRPTVVTPAEAKVVRDRQRAQRQRFAVAKRMSLIVLALLVVTGIGYLVMQKITPDVDAPEIGAVAEELVLGEEGAPHDVIIYEDFRCPVCGVLERKLGDELASLAAEGKVRVAYRPFDLLGGWSVDAAATFAVVLEEAGPETAAKFHQILYAQQPEERADNPGREWFVARAVEAGADADAVRAGLETGSGKEWVARATDAAEEAEVRGTPTVLLDGEVFEEDRAPADRAERLLRALR
ncbi:DsbA family protein [Nocardioides daejeonensis]|uniref:DsbA family protein n=1 Tax=Nocardioides daejeonensis TaxID=1046556 RepID=UPI000D74D7BD|nr:thioredoxin domain-containing protein [Nocardioides daejeonensis]